MTANQLIAVLFPLATAAGAVLTALIAKKLWVDRPISGAGSVEVMMTNMAVYEMSNVTEALSEADRLIQAARRELEQATKQ